jgi:hypothetical protein
MKITNSLLLFIILSASIFYAKPSTANECSNNPDNISPTSDLVSIGNRVRKANAHFQLYTFTESSKFAVSACTVTEQTVIKFAIPDDSPLSMVDVNLYVNGRRAGYRRMTRGTSIRLNFTPERVQDYKIEWWKDIFY